MKVMKRLLSATLALSLLGATAASAAPYGYGDQGYSDGYSNSYRDDGYRDRGTDNGPAIAAGIGLLALVAIMASQNHRHDGYRNDWRDDRRDGWRDDRRGGWRDDRRGGWNDRGDRWGHGYDRGFDGGRFGR
jgi:hypothetical protein